MTKCFQQPKTVLIMFGKKKTKSGVMFFEKTSGKHLACISSKNIFFYFGKVVILEL